MPPARRGANVALTQYVQEKLAKHFSSKDDKDMRRKSQIAVVEAEQNELRDLLSRRVDQVEEAAKPAPPPPPDRESESDPAHIQVNDFKERIVRGSTHEFKIIAHDRHGYRRTDGGETVRSLLNPQPRPVTQLAHT